MPQEAPTNDAITVSPNATPFGFSEVGLDRADHVHSDFVLKRENVVKLAVISLNPQMNAGFRVNKLDSNAYAISNFAHTAFEQIAHVEISSNLLDVNRLAFVDEA